MKKVFVVLLFLFLISCASSMNGPIKVVAEPDDAVSVFIWTFGGGPLLNSDNGVADDDGVFMTKTFFSLRAPYKIIVVIRGWADSFEQEVEGSEFDNGMDIDCTSGECFISASEFVENNSAVEEIVVVNETTENISEVIVDESVVEEIENESVLLTGKVSSSKEGGSFDWVFSVGSFVVLLFLVVFIFVMFRRRKSGEMVLDSEERELKCVKREIKETEEKIERIKKEDVEKIIHEAKLRLANEKRELSELESRRDRMKR